MGRLVLVWLIFAGLKRLKEPVQRPLRSWRCSLNKYSTSTKTGFALGKKVHPLTKRLHSHSFAASDFLYEHCVLLRMKSNEGSHGLGSVFTELSAEGLWSLTQVVLQFK